MAMVPSGRTDAGYRVYTGADLDRLRHVLVHRELGFALDDVAALLDGDPDDRARLVREQLARVTDRIDRLLDIAGDRARAVAENHGGGKATAAELDAGAAGSLADAIAAEARAIAALGEDLASTRPRTGVVADAYADADRRGSRLL